MISWIISFCKGWYRFLFLPKSELSKSRLKICAGCSFKKGFMWWSYCGICTCPLDAKTESPDEECPLGMWKQPPPSSCGFNNTHSNLGNYPYPK